MNSQVKTRALKGQLADIKSRQEVLSAYWGEGNNLPCLHFFAKFMSRLVDADNCRIFVQTPNDKTVWMEAGTGVECGKLIVPAEGSVIDEVIKSGKPQLLNNPDQASIRESEPHLPDTHNLLCIPILSLENASVVGAVELSNKAATDGFSKEDQATLEEMAHYLQMSLENIYLNREMCNVSETAVDRLSEFTTLVGGTILGTFTLGFLALIAIYIIPKFLN